MTFGQRLDALARAVLDHELEAAGLAQAPDRRRLEDHHHGVADLLGSLPLELLGQAGRPQLRRRRGAASPRG